jgi:hypothetical protein
LSIDDPHVRGHFRLGPRFPAGKVQHLIGEGRWRADRRKEETGEDAQKRQQYRDFE